MTIRKSNTRAAKTDRHSFASGNAAVYFGDCRKVLLKLPSECADLIITSPPYADRRRKTYGGIPPDKYVEWFLPIAKQLFRALKPRGTFILNIKENAVNG